MNPKDNADRVWYRLWRALTLRPLWIDTGGGPRKDRLDHAYINVFTEAWRDALRRPEQDDVSQLLGQVTGIGVVLGAVWLIA